MGYALKEAFLSPEKFADVGAASILLGMTHQQMNEVDEFVTPALNQGLLGQPLDLASINIARGRDLGIPTLNDFREAVGLAKYTSWNDFGQNMQHPSSLANFIAAYSFDGDLDKGHAMVDLADGVVLTAAEQLIVTANGWTASTALDFLNGGNLDFNFIDTWIGGLAEIHQPGGILGETFDKVFVDQIEKLMDGDRFYYLYRLAGQQLGEEVGNAQLKDIVERNTGLTHLNGNIFGYQDQYVDLGAHRDVSALIVNGGTATTIYDTTVNATTLMLDINSGNTVSNEHKYGDNVLVDTGAIGVYSNGGHGNANDGNTVTVGGQQYILDTRVADSIAGSAYDQNGGVNLDGTLNSGAESNEIIVGSKGNDLIYAQGGDDTVYGDGGNDIIWGGYGIDRLYGGAGADVLHGGDNPDLMDGGSGDDVLYGDSSGTDINGLDQLIGGSGNDILHGGLGIDKLSAGSGDDVIYGEQDTDPATHGGDGNDIVDGGSGTDVLYGDNGDDIVIDGADVDISFGGAGDDILQVGDIAQALGLGPDEIIGGDFTSDDGNTPNTIGFDMADFSLQTKRNVGIDFTLGIQNNPLVAINNQQIVPAAFQLEGTVGSQNNDTLEGSNIGDAGLTGNLAQFDMGENWLIGGSGNDKLIGLGGNDVIIGGSVRLDSLIGHYQTTYNHNLNNDGLTQADQLQDALYKGASYRVAFDDTLVGGVLGGADTQEFAKHYTEMLRSFQFKDVVLGDNGGLTAGGSDTAVYSGNASDYTAVYVDANGAETDFAHAYGVRIHDMRTVDATGNVIDPTDGSVLVDANGVPVPGDGVDLVIGVANFQFADVTRSFAAIENIPALRGSANILHSDLTGIAATPTAWQWQVSSDNGVTFTNIVGATNEAYTVTDQNFYRVVVSFVDSLGGTENIATLMQGRVGTALADNPFDGNSAPNLLNGLGGNDVLNGLAGNDKINGGDGTDTLNGGDGNDRMWGGNGNDIVNGGNGDDTVIVMINDTGTDTIDGGTNGAGGDTVQLWGGAGNQTMNVVYNGTTLTSMTGVNGALTGVEHTTLDLSTGNDTLSYAATLAANGVTVNMVTGTASGFDSIAGVENVTGGAGNDTFIADANNARNNFDGGAGVDTADYSAATANLTVTLNGATQATVTGSGANAFNSDRVQNIENFVGGSGNDTINGSAGNNSLSGGAGNDTFNYTVTTTGLVVTSGRDFVDGGTTALDINSRDIGSDTFVLNGSAVAETFKIMTRAAAITAGITGLNATTEIVVTRQAGNAVLATNFLNLAVVAELDNIEEIRVNTLDVTANNANGGLDSGLNGGDRIQILGAFGTSTNATTSLNFSTITINGGANDTVDISGLESDHRIVFNGAASPNQIIGNLRPQDVVHYGSSGETDQGSGGSGGDEVVAPPPPPAPPAPADLTLIGDDTANLLTGGAGNDTALGRGGDDMITTGSGDDFVDGGAGGDTIMAGAGNDIVMGQDGGDVIFGGDGNDMITGGNGDDTAFGGAGDDTFVATANDGSDSYHGDAGVDTLDMSAVMANITANLGSGLAGWATAGGVTDQLYSIENIITGGGNDTITASGAVNMIDVGTHSGAGHDTVVFHAASDANGDTILNFEAGDKIDVSGFMGGTINLVNGTTAAAGQIAVSFENVGGENFTVLHGHDANDNEFQLNIKGHHELTGTDFAA